MPADLEDLHQQEAAQEAMLRVAMFMVASAREASGFPPSREGIEALLADIGQRVPAIRLAYLPREPTDKDWPERDSRVLLVTPADGESLHLSCWFDRSHSLEADLHRDGRLTDEATGVGLSIDDPEGRIELDEQDQAALTEISTRLAEEGLHPQRGSAFSGEEYLRAVAAPPQPNAPVQITSVELYADGLIVNFVVPDPSDWQPEVPLQLYERAGMDPPIERLTEKAKRAGGNLAPSISVDDDAGTEYKWCEGGVSGVQVQRGAHTFTPAVPDAASGLRISTYAGTVQLDLS